VLPVRDLIDEGEWLSLVFEPRRTITLRELLSAGPVSPELLQPLTTALFEGLSAAHQGALLHTQISPEAVWFDTQKRPLLAEFGLARRTAQELRDHWPHDPRYAAPELLSGGPYTPQTDLYALAATLLEAATGTALSPVSARQQGVRLPSWPAGIPPQVAHALESCLQLDPAVRAVSAAEVLEELRRAQPTQAILSQQEPPAPPPSVPSPPAAPQSPDPGPTQSRAGFPWWIPLVIGLVVLGGYKLASTPRSSTVTAVSESTSENDVSAPTETPEEVQVPVAEQSQTEEQPPEPEPSPPAEPVPTDPEPPAAIIPPPEATPVEALPPSEDPITDDEVVTFVDDYLAAGSGHDLTAAINHYADRVTYFDQGLQAKAALRKDKAGYFKRWPERSYQRVSEVQTLSEGANTRQVRFNYSYDLTRPGKQLTGQAYTDLGLIKTGGQLFITSETGKIFKELQHSVTTELPTEPSADTVAESSETRQGAPKFLNWTFGGCVDDAGGTEQAYLTPGQIQHCAVVIETIPNGTSPIRAVFNYELEYEEDGTTQKFPIDAPDVWPSQTAGVLATDFLQDGSTLIFTLPLTVRERSDRSYTQINAIGTVTFDNGSEKNVYVKIPIYR